MLSSTSVGMFAGRPGGLGPDLPQNKSRRSYNNDPGSESTRSKMGIRKWCWDVHCILYARWDRWTTASDIFCEHLAHGDTKINMDKPAKDKMLGIDITRS